jgi:hypothetical protein
VRPAYVDTSCLVAIAFDEPGGAELSIALDQFGPLFGSNLVEAELRSAAVREGVPDEAVTPVLNGVTWVLPDRLLSGEIARVLEVGYARGADLWHFATALYLAGDPRDLAFLTLDERQRELAAALGFGTPT